MPIGFEPTCSNIDMKNIADQFFNSGMPANALRSLLNARNSNTVIPSTSIANGEDAVEAINTSAVALKKNIDNTESDRTSKRKLLMNYVEIVSEDVNTQFGGEHQHNLTNVSDLVIGDDDVTNSTYNKKTRDDTNRHGRNNADSLARSYCNSSRTYNEIQNPTDSFGIGIQNEVKYAFHNGNATNLKKATNLKNHSTNENSNSDHRPSIRVGAKFRGIANGKITFAGTNKVVVSRSTNRDVIIGAQVDLSNHEGDFTFAEKNTVIIEN